MAQVDFCKISGEIALRLDNRPSMKLVISYGDGQRRGVCVYYCYFALHNGA